MANIKSAKKRAKQNKVRNTLKSSQRSKTRTAIKAVESAIESGDKSIRLEVSKGKFEDVDVKKVIRKVHDADINVMANYIYGLPGDTDKTMKKTLHN